MKASNHPQLGRVVAEVSRTINGNENDPMNAYAGFTPSSEWAVEKIVKAEGFANTRHFAAVVARRTSPRWAYMNLSF